MGVAHFLEKTQDVLVGDEKRTAKKMAGAGRRKSG